eukprot:8138364-Ditylum_brightwellii.AAC.1
MHRYRHYFDWSKHKKGEKSSGRSYKGAKGDKYKEQASPFFCNNISLIPQDKISKGANKTKHHAFPARVC